MRQVLLPRRDPYGKKGGTGMLRNGLQPWHLLILAVVVIAVFGSKKLPDTARALGKSMRILKSEARAMKDESTP
ncbi:Sec-independent protein translocase subunit TatA [Streptomyces filamentosus]|uniref:Sec-independent protein translocase protein TatA n=5 Tax=Streptomyces TaxID=1883 RepID=A0ABY4UPV2_STRFL|nr:MULTISPECIES: Sec-independent protein translocase subunit TatA [Streptomyces]MCC8477432.1 Sec-independent protein translocase subunit TatA [Streptomyces globisporus]MCQ1578031.1 Sec-independent protein translocase subunit TatA [Streptomyces parvus]UCA51247.1 Sec-independent protein translocase subunit TatA [Streptomyces sp. WA6-1-16]USC45350.1 Sec-independent protein translocase subunit TatA [Streptomyces filamentosus]